MADNQSIIGRGAIFKGKISNASTIEINGRVEAEELFNNLTRAVNAPISTLENVNLSRNLLYNDGLRKLTDGFVRNEGFGKINSFSLLSSNFRTLH